MQRGPRAALTRSASSSPSTTSRTRPARSFPSPFEEAAILTLDGVGEWATASFGYRPRQPDRADARACAFRTRSACSTRRSPTSRGFKVNSGEYKLMGLAPYGEPTYVDLILEQPDRPEGRRLVPHGHVVLQLLPGPDDDVAEVRRAVRRPAAQAGGAAHAARHGPRRVDPGGHRRDHAAHARGTSTRRPA